MTVLLSEWFRQPAFLWALPLGLVPIIIYYLMRFRSLRVAWGANYVLERALRRLRQKLYWDQILLIVLRVLACLVIVVAFARPLAPQKSATGGSGVHHVLVVDGSYSLLAGERDQTRWDRARDLLGRLIATWPRGDSWSVLYLGEKAEWRVDSETLGAPEAAVARLVALEPSECAVTLDRAFDLVRGRFPNTPLDLYVVADDQATTWAGAEVAAAAGPLPRALWLNPAAGPTDNLAVTAVRLESDRVLLRHPVRAFIAVRNCSGGPASDLEVEVLVDGIFQRKETLALLPGQESWVTVDLAFDVPGPHYITARLPTDALDFDNSLSAGVEVVDKLRVVVLRSPDAKGKFASCWGFLESLGTAQALKDEDEAPVFKFGPLEFTLAEGDEPPALGPADLVIVDGGRRLTPALVAALRPWVRRGGALILAADDHAELTTWNELLGQAGLLPAPLARLRIEPLGSERGQSLLRTDFGAPGLRAFEGADNGDWSAARCFAWHEFGEPAPGVEVLARFGNRDPFALLQTFRPGAVLLLAAGLNGASNNLVVREFFPTLVFRLVAVAAGAGAYPRTVARGDPLGLRLPEASGVRGFTLTTPGREPAAVPARVDDGTIEALVPEGSPRSGLCSLLALGAPGAPRVWFGVQGPRVDSDLTALDPVRRQQLTQSLNLTEVKDWPALSAILEGERGGNELHHWAIIALLFVLLGEMALTLRFV